MASVLFERRRPLRLRDVFQKSFLERSPRTIGAIGISAMLAGSLFALLLTGGVFARTYRVTAVFTDAGGIVPGDNFTLTPKDLIRIEISGIGTLENSVVIV